MRAGADGSERSPVHPLHERQHGETEGILHGTGGYLLYATLTSKYVFDLKEHDIFWCTADAGWITGHSYLVYGPLSN